MLLRNNPPTDNTMYAVIGETIISA